MPIPEGTENFPIGNYTAVVGSKTYEIDSYDIPEETARIINRTDEFGGSQDYSIRKQSEKVQGTIGLHRNDEVDPSLALDTPDACYSIRKVIPTYTGDALRVRRSSDNFEVTLGYDSEDKISLGSPISNISEQDGEMGQTGATTLGAFLSETKDTSRSYDHSLDPMDVQNVYVRVGRYGSSNPTSYDSNSNVDSLPAIPDGSRYATKWTSTNANFGWSFGRAYNGDTYTVEFDLLQQSGTEDIRFANSNAMDLYPHTNISEGSLSGGKFTTKDQWVHFKMTFRTGENKSGTALIRSSNTSVQTTWYVANLKFTPTTESSAFVHTWYDQTGSNDAVQESSISQPKIADNGALIADGLDFDGGYHNLRTASNIDSSQPVTVFSVTKPNSVNKRIFESISNTVRAFYGSSSQTGINAGTSLLGATNEVLPNSENLQTHLFNGANSKVFLNNSESISGDAGANAFAGQFSIGGSTSLFSGNMKEIILYTSNQLDDRSKIEANINDAHSVYSSSDEAGLFVELSGSDIPQSGSPISATVGTETLSGYITDVKVIRSKDASDTYECGVLLS